MSSVQDYDKCPQCGGIYVMDFDCRTLEEFRYCNRCGKREAFTRQTDQQGNFVLDGEGRIQYQFTSSTGYGCLAVADKKGSRAIYNLLNSVNDEIRMDYLEMIKNPDVDPEKCYLTSWDPQMQEITAVFGKLPLSFDESMVDTEGDEAESA